jgi:hypothetical protein
MDDEKILARLSQAIETAGKAWSNTHRGLPKNPMTRTAAIPATGILAATLLEQIDGDPGRVLARAERAIVIARRAWERTHHQSAGNPMAATAEKSVIGILAAGILKYEFDCEASGEATGPTMGEEVE